MGGIRWGQCCWCVCGQLTKTFSRREHKLRRGNKGLTALTFLCTSMFGGGGNMRGQEEFRVRLYLLQMHPKGITPRFERSTDVIATAVPWMVFAFGGALVVFSIWGFWLCRSLSDSFLTPPQPGISSLVTVLSWLVLFLPLAILGIFVLWFTLKQMLKDKSVGRSQGRIQVEIMPPGSQSISHSRELERRHFAQTVTEPLDEATTLRLDKLADRAARIFSVTAGLLLLLGGVAGFVMMWLYSHRPVARTSLPYEFADFRLTTLLSVGCGLIVILGLIILRETFKKSGTEWLAPLRVFTLIVSRRAAMEQSACGRKNT